MTWLMFIGDVLEVSSAALNELSLCADWQLQDFVE
jgi:hypothetical protein